MTVDATLTLVILLGAVILFAWEKLPVDLVAMLVLASVLVLGLVTPAEALSGFASEATITVAAMFVLSAGLSRSGALAGIGRWFARIKNGWVFTLAVMTTLAAMSAFVNNTAAVAVFLPVVLAVAAANKFSASKVLIPMSYAAQMGGVCTLIGTSTNLLVHSLAKDMGLEGFSLFEFAPLGLITTAVGMVYLMIFGPWLLPDRRTAELSQNYELGKYITELRVMEDSPLIGKSVAEAKLGEKHGVYVLELLRGDEKIWSPRAQRLAEGDVLLARGEWSRLVALKDQSRLALEPKFTLKDTHFSEADQVLSEVMVAPGSRFIGHTVAELDFQWHYNAIALAIHRRGEVLREKLKDTRLTIGDILLLVTSREETRALRANRNLVVLTERDDINANPRKAWTALGIMVSVLICTMVGWLPIVSSAILGCIALVATKGLEPEELYEAIDWRVIVLLAGVLPLGIAMQKSGAADLIAGNTLDLVGGHGPLVVLAAIYFLTSLLTAAMSNNATAVLMVPIAAAAATALGVSPMPFLVAVAFAASTSFATPVGYQTNTMVYNAGGYRFTDFVKLGLPLNVLLLVVAMLVIPKFWPF